MQQPSPRLREMLPGFLDCLLGVTILLLAPGVSKASPSWPAWIGEPAADLASKIVTLADTPELVSVSFAVRRGGACAARGLNFGSVAQTFGR